MLDRRRRIETKYAAIYARLETIVSRADEFLGSIIFDLLQRGVRDIKHRKADGYECDDEAQVIILAHFYAFGKHPQQGAKDKYAHYICIFIHYSKRDAAAAKYHYDPAEAYCCFLISKIEK